MNCNIQQSDAKIKAVRGNTLTLAIPLQDKIWRVENGQRTSETNDFYPLETDEIIVSMKSAYKTFTLPSTVSGNIVTVTDNGTLPVGCFGIEINVNRASGDVRRYFNSCEVHVVEHTKDAGIDDGTEFDVITHELDAAIFEIMRGYSAYEIWLQQGYEGTEADFLVWLSGEAQINELIAQVYQDLNNYYQKSSVYNKSEIDNMMSEIPKFAIRVVSSLPTSGISTTTIYLVPGSYSEAGNLYTEYIYTNGRWEVLGKQNFDLSNYVTTTNLNQALDLYYTKSAVESLLNGYVQKVTNMGLSSNDFTDVLKAKLEAISDYDDNEIRGLISGLQGQIDTLVSGDATSAIESFNEIIAFLANVDDEQTLSGIVAAINTSIAAKANSSDVYDKTASDARYATKTEIDGIAIWGSTTASVTTADFDPQTDTVWNIEQTLSPSAQAQARENISAASTDTFGASGSGHAAGLVPDPGSSTGTTRFLCENATWAVPFGSGGGSGDENVIESITFNGDEVSVDENKNAAITYTAPVTSVNNQTGAVTISTGDANVIEGVKLSGESDVISPSSKIVTIPTMGASGTNHKVGLVPDPGSNQGTSRYLREDGTWQTPPDNNTNYTASDFDIKDLTDSTSLRAAWSGKQDALTTQTAYTSKGSATKVPQITTNTLGQVTGITEVTITQPDVSNFISTSSTTGLVKNDGSITSVKTVNGESILGSGNISVSSGTGGDANVIESITFNGSAVSVDSNKNAAITYTAPVTSVNNQTGAVTISVPTKVSDLTNDSGFTSNTGTITSVKMNGSPIASSGEADLGTVVTSETSLSKGTTSGEGNAVTDISVSGHQITLTKGSTFLTSETSLSLGTTSGSGNAVTDISVSGHAITMTKGSTFLTSSDISGKADKSEMSVVAGTGNDANKTTITLKSGMSATVINTLPSNIVVGNTQSYSIAVVSSMPPTPDENTIYFVTSS